MIVLAVNCGSLSLKWAPARACLVERIRGSDVPYHAPAVKEMLTRLRDLGAPRPDAVGHRIVHSGASRTEPAIVDDRFVTELAALEELASMLPPVCSVSRVKNSWMDPRLPPWSIADHPKASSSTRATTVAIRAAPPSRGRTNGPWAALRDPR
jgi:acetate kinase